MALTLDSSLADLTSGDDERAEAGIAKLAALAGTSPAPVFEALQQLARSADVDTRWWGVRAFAAIPDPRAPAELARALGDPHSSVRQCAALGLRLRPDAAAQAALVELLDDSDGLCADLAVDALTALGGEAVPALIETLAGGSARARLGAARALAEIGDPRAIPALFSVLDDESALIEHWASQGLERMGVGMVFFRPDG